MIVHTEALAKLLIDTDDKVRAAACTVFEEIDYETASHHVSERTLRMFGERCKDKKVRYSFIHLQVKKLFLKNFAKKKKKILTFLDFLFFIFIYIELGKCSSYSFPIFRSTL